MTQESISRWPAFGSHIRKIGPILYNELNHYRQQLLPELERQKFANWEELEHREPEVAQEVFERLRKIESSFCKKFGLPSDERMLKEAAVETYNTLVMQIDALHEEALLGNVESIFCLSSLYLVGEEVSKNQDFAFRLLKYAAEQGFEPAVPLIAECFMKGLGTTENPDEAVRWILRCDYRQDEELLAFMGTCFLTGTALPQDIEKAWECFLDAVELGHRDAFHLCKAAAEAGNVRGQYLLGRIFLYGITVPTNVSLALHWFHQAAQQN